MSEDICQQNGRLLAIDYGTKRVGIAVSDPLYLVGMPLCTVMVPDLFNFLHEYCQKEKVGLFLLGYPLTLRGECNMWTNQIIKLKTRLQKDFPSQKVLLLDERMTSKIASRTIHSLNLKRKQKHDKSNIDSMAAAILLNDYLQNPSCII